MKPHESNLDAIKYGLGMGDVHQIHFIIPICVEKSMNEITNFSNSVFVGSYEACVRRIESGVLEKEKYKII